MKPIKAFRDNVSTVSNLYAGVVFCRTDLFGECPSVLPHFRSLASLNGILSNWQVQIVTLSADAALSGEFTVTYPGIGSTEPLPHDASSEVFASAIRALGSNIGREVTISRSRTGVRGYAWTVTFDDLDAGNRPQLVATANSSLETRASDGALLLDVETVTDGVGVVRGTFDIAFGVEEFEGNIESTGPLPYDVSAREVEVAIEALSSVGDVSVDVELLDGGDRGRMFIVSWPASRGNMPLLHVNGSGLTPTADETGESEAAVAYVNEVGDGICYVFEDVGVVGTLFIGGTLAADTNRLNSEVFSVVPSF